VAKAHSEPGEQIRAQRLREHRCRMSTRRRRGARDGSIHEGATRTITPLSTQTESSTEHEGRVYVLHARRPVTLVTGIIAPSLLSCDMASALEFETFAEECIRLAKQSANRHNRDMMWRMAAACLLIAQVLTECEQEQGVNSRLADLARHLH